MENGALTPVPVPVPKEEEEVAVVVVVVTDLSPMTREPPVAADGVPVAIPGE